MAELLDTDPQPLVYWDRKQFTNFQDQVRRFVSKKETGGGARGGGIGPRSTHGVARAWHETRLAREGK